MELFTLGHSNHPPDKFVKLLMDNEIECVVDVRSRPYSRWASFANRENLEKLLASINILYLYLGSLLGGLVPGLYRKNRAERLQAYDSIRQEKYFNEGIDKLIEEIKKHRTCILCAEENPADCHRTLLIGVSIAATGVQILHIRGDGRVEKQLNI
ncbi:MAG: DUF488 domain-containing protein [Dehalococcoidia bacterium]|nr:DUF488 domain-containing protein [Dehalococcoidia bacterium]